MNRIMVWASMLFGTMEQNKKTVEDKLAPVLAMTQEAIDNADCRKVRAIMHELSPDATKMVMDRLDPVSRSIVVSCIALGIKPSTEML